MMTLSMTIQSMTAMPVDIAEDDHQYVVFGNGLPCRSNRTTCGTTVAMDLWTMFTHALLKVAPRCSLT